MYIYIYLSTVRILLCSNFVGLRRAATDRKNMLRQVNSLSALGILVHVLTPYANIDIS